MIFNRRKCKLQLITDHKYLLGYDVNLLGFVCYHATEDIMPLRKTHKCKKVALYVCLTCTEHITGPAFPVKLCYNCVGPSAHTKDEPRGQWLQETEGYASEFCYHARATIELMKIRRDMELKGKERVKKLPKEVSDLIKIASTTSNKSKNNKKRSFNGDEEDARLPQEQDVDVDDDASITSSEFDTFFT